MMKPRDIGLDHVVNQIICMATAFVICAVFDRLFCRRFKRPYFALHVFANIVIVALVFPGAIRALLNPTKSSVIPPGVQGPNALYLAWIYALHGNEIPMPRGAFTAASPNTAPERSFNPRTRVVRVRADARRLPRILLRRAVYHPIFFKTGIMDWVHHIPVYILNTLCFSIPSSDVLLLQALIMVGVPGGLDYLLQVFEGEGKLSRAYYKELCSEINTWCRAPLGAVGAYVCFAGLYHGWDDATYYQRFTLILLGVHAAWNPQFFCRQAVEANIVDTINRHGLVGASGKDGLRLPRIRALCGKLARSDDGKAPPEVAVRSPRREPMDEAFPIGSGRPTRSSLNKGDGQPAASPVSVTFAEKTKVM